MRLDDERESNNIEDRRGESGGGIGRTGGIGIGTGVIALAASYFLGLDPRVVLGLAESVQNVQHSTPSTQQPRPVDPATDPDDPTKRQAPKILAKTQDTCAC